MESPRLKALLLVVLIALYSTAQSRQDRRLDQALNALANGTPAQRLAAVDALAGFNEYDAWMEIARVAGEAVGDVRIRAIQALGRLPDDHGRLFSIHGRPSIDACNRAISSVEQGSQGALKPLLDRMREAFIEVDQIEPQFGSLVSTAFHRALLDPRASTRATGLTAASHFFWGLSGVTDPDRGTRCGFGSVRDSVPGAVAMALVAMAKADPRELLGLASEMDVDRSSAPLNALAEAGVKTAIPIALRWLDSKNPDIRFGGTDFFVLLPDDRALSSLARLLGDPNERVRIGAMVALDGLQPTSVKYVIDELDRMPAQLASGSLRWLSTINSDVTALAVMPRISTQDIEAQAWLIEELGYMRRPSDDEYHAPDRGFVSPTVEQQVAKYLASRLQDRSPEIRRAAASAMECHLDSRYADLVAPLAFDSDVKVREQAIQCLGSFKQARFVKVFEQALLEKEIRSTAAQALRELGSAAVPALERASVHRDENVRYWAIVASGPIEDSICVEIMIKGLSDSSAHVREAAAEALREQKPPSALDRLITCCDDSSEDVRAAVYRALAEFGDLRALPKLLERKQAAAPEERCRVVEAIHQVLRAKG